MTLLMAARAADGLAAISDRMEAYRNRPPKGVKKYRLGKKGGFYTSLAGDGKLAKGIPGEVARARTWYAGAVKRIRGIALSLSRKPKQRSAGAAGILITAERRGSRLYDVDINGTDVSVNESGDDVSVHGDGGALGVCRYVTAKVGLSGTTCETAARRIHALASDVGRYVKSVGGPGHGFDLILLAAGGHARVLERCTGEFGWIDEASAQLAANFRMIAHRPRTTGSTCKKLLK